ncbi:MAG: site-2 protease family protein [Flavonifractor plautii]
MIAINLAVMNLLPIPALDGGQHLLPGGGRLFTTCSPAGDRPQVLRLCQYGGLCLACIALMAGGGRQRRGRSNNIDF